ncbi:hypothetical protein GBA52_001827 [Prunus armeniaca]|nr:hypothetical protein GBA52_001827 [Prunus armeniaca]
MSLKLKHIPIPVVENQERVLAPIADDTHLRLRRCRQSRATMPSNLHHIVKFTQFSVYDCRNYDFAYENHNNIGSGCCWYGR